MKRIILTESQYKRLVKQPLNEQEIIFGDGYSLGDMKNVNNIHIIVSLHDSLWYDYKQNLYIKSVDEDKVIIDLEKYDEEVKEYIKKTMDMFLIMSDNPVDSIDDKGNIDFSSDTEPVEGEEQEVVDDFVSTELDEIPDGSLSSEIPTELHDLMYLVSSKEAKRHSYDSAFSSKIIDGLSDMTIEEAKAANGSSAVGRWQFMPEYIESFATRAGLKMTDKFNQTNQDKMAMQFIPGWKNWSCKKLGQKIATTWAAMPVLYDQHRPKYKEIPARELVRGESYYEGVSSNTAGVTADKFETALRKTGCNVSSDKSNSEDETVTVKDVPNIPFRNKTEGNAFRKWVNDNHKEYADKINLSPTGDWKEGQKNFKGFMLKAWNEHGKKYIDDGGYKELEEIKLEDTEICETKPDPNKSNLSRIKFDSIPNSTNFRSGQPTLPQLAYILDTYDIKHIVRMNGTNETSPVGKTKVTFKEEKAMAECYDVEYHFINAHKPNIGVGEIVDGVTLGYTKSMEEIQKILSEGNTLIHCRNGSDRTGYQVAKYRKDRGMTDEQALWDYTLKYNGWCEQTPKKFNSGYDAYAQGFINGLDEKKRQELCNGRVNKDKMVKDYESPEIE